MSISVSDRAVLLVVVRVMLMCDLVGICIPFVVWRRMVDGGTVNANA
jgi:hypothetical protein